MDISEATQAVQLVRSRAVADAAVARREAQSQAETWGINQARKLVRRTPGPGESGRSTFRVPLASRPLRDWYLHVYSRTLLKNLAGQVSQQLQPTSSGPRLRSTGSPRPHPGKRRYK